MPRRIIARTALRDLAFDIQMQLNNNIDPKKICDISMRRLKQLSNKGFNYFTDWSREGEGVEHKAKKEKPESDYDKWEKETFGDGKSKSKSK